MIKIGNMMHILFAFTRKQTADADADRLIFFSEIAFDPVSFGIINGNSSAAGSIRPVQPVHSRHINAVVRSPGGKMNAPVGLYYTPMIRPSVE